MRNTTLVLASLLFSAPALAAGDLFAYPNAGQDPDQQRRDRYECHRWAVGQTGFDPSTATAPGGFTTVRVAGGPRPDHRINPVTGAAGGAAMGAVGGAIGGDAGKGAAIGAGVGAVAGLLYAMNADARAREQARRQAVHHAVVRNDQVEQYEEDRHRYNRAIGACLTARDYTVR